MKNTERLLRVDIEDLHSEALRADVGRLRLDHLLHRLERHAIVHRGGGRGFLQLLGRDRVERLRGRLDPCSWSLSRIVAVMLAFCPHRAAPLATARFGSCSCGWTPVAVWTRGAIIGMSDEPPTSSTRSSA